MKSSSSTRKARAKSPVEDAFKTFYDLARQFQYDLRLEKTAEHTHGRWHVVYASGDWSRKKYWRIVGNLREIKRTIREKVGKPVFIEIQRKPVEKLIGGKTVKWNLKIGVLKEES